MMSNLRFQITQLAESLSGFKADQRVEWQVGKMANAMIEQAKQEARGNPVVEAIDPFQPGPNDVYISNAGAGAVRAVLQQLVAALPSEGPMIA